MMVIAKRAEKKLRQEIQRYAKEKPKQACFFIQFSETDLDNDFIFEAFLKRLNVVPNSYMAQVYVCQDKDIFILMQGFMQRHFSYFLKELAEDLDDMSIMKLSDIFEIGPHQKILENMCAEKITRIEAQQEQETAYHQKQKEDRATMEVLSKLDRDLISTLHERRDHRDAPLIMIVDDDQLSRTLAGNVINKEYEIAYAQNGQEALREFVARAPDVIFLDIGLPDINGHQILECIFQIDPEAYVIMFSGRKDKSNIMRALQTGAQGFVGKPFTRNKLFEYIEKSPFIRDKQSHEIPETSFISQEQ